MVVTRLVAGGALLAVGLLVLAKSRSVADWYGRQQLDNVRHASLLNPDRKQREVEWWRDGDGQRLARIGAVGFGVFLLVGALLTLLG